MTVHRTLGPGFLESVYRNSLRHELGKSGLEVEAEKHLMVHYDGEAVGHFIADLIINQKIILELKAASALSTADNQQLVNYLKATGLDTGLLINFGTRSLEFRRKQRSLPLKDRIQ